MEPSINFRHALETLKDDMKFNNSQFLQFAFFLDLQHLVYLNVKMMLVSDPYFL